jgi:ABC-type polysaccharide/polyol phosphate transport system ATPase subunit
MDKNIAINLKNIRKTYLLHHEKPTFVESVIKKRNSEIFTAIDNLNLKINKGERVGIMGSNGCGKTTLLKLMSHITVPDQGEVFTNGRVVSLIDLNAGFHPDLTGEENIFLNGLVLGLNRQEIIKNYKSIIEFADINKFIDSPLYTYSSGMRLRLGFSVAIHSNPDILVLDENISVGDQDFKIKIDSKINELAENKKTIVLVTQYKQYLEKFCNRFIIMEDGKIKRDGLKDVLNEYFKY